MIKIHVNGDILEISENATLSELAKHMSLEGKLYAIEVNEDIVPRSEHPQFSLNENDIIEVVQAIGGG